MKVLFFLLVFFFIIGGAMLALALLGVFISTLIALVSVMPLALVVGSLGYGILKMID